MIPLPFRGQGGDKKGGGDDADNTLRSKARARFVEIYAEGPIEGLVGGLQGVYFNETPVKNPDGTFNYEGVTLDEHTGLADEGYFKGHSDGVQTPTAVDLKATYSVPRSIQFVAPDADAVMVVVRVDSLFKIDSDDGTVQSNDLQYALDLKVGIGAWTEVVNITLDDEKFMSPVQFEHRIDLPNDNGAGWSVRLRRVTADETDDKAQSDLTFESYAPITEGKFMYPHSAGVAIGIDAENFGSSAVPNRAYRIRGRKVKIPANYDPIAKTYATSGAGTTNGAWNGQFASNRQWTDNPAWILFDLLTDPRVGLGEFLDITTVDRWSLYQIGQYCDQKVPSGFKTQGGADILEPRYTFNGVLNTRQEAFKVVQQIATAFRGMAYWSLGSVFATADMPGDAVKLVGPANVIGGRFGYTSTANKARHSVALVQWNNPEDFYRPATEPYIHPEALKAVGWREKSISLQGCTSRGLAHRYGKWAVDLENAETETVTYTASLDHLDVVPGNIIAINDPRRANARAAGRVVSHVGDDLTIDAPFQLAAGETYKIRWVATDGAIIERDIQGKTAPAVLTVVSGAKAPVNAMFMIVGTDVAPREYRVLSVNDVGDGLFQVTALFHDPTKYARVEFGINLDPPPYTRPLDTLKPPRNPVLVEVDYQNGARALSRLTLSWTPPTGVVVKHYEVRVDTPIDKNLLVAETAATSIDFNTYEPGTHTFKVRTVDHLGRRSDPMVVSHIVKLDGAYGAISVANLRLDEGSGTTFTDDSPTITWDNVFPESSAPAATKAQGSSKSNPRYSHNEINVYRTSDGALLRTARVTGTRYTYKLAQNVADNPTSGAQAGPKRNLRFEVRVVDRDGKVSLWEPLTVNNPSPNTPNLSVSVSGQVINLTWTQPDDIDYRGTLVWIEGNSTFDPYATTPKFDGKGNFFQWTGQTGSTYWIRVGSYDSFSKTGLNISAAIQVTTGNGYVFDTDDPAEPTALVLTEEMRGQNAWIVASWTASPSTDVSGYDVGIRTAPSGNWVDGFTSGTRFEFQVEPGGTYDVRVRASDHVSHRSNYLTGSITHTGDKVPPAVVTGLTVQPGFTVLVLNWTPVPDADVSHYEIYESATATPVPVAGTAPTYRTGGTTPSFLTAATAMLRANLPDGATRHYWVRAVDTSGNKSSAWSTRVAGTTTLTAGLDSADVAGLINATSFAAGHAPIEIVTTLPNTGNFQGRTVLLTSDSKLYRHTGTPADASGFTKAVDGLDLLADSVTTGAIRAGAITTSQLAAQSVTFEKMIGISNENGQPLWDMDGVTTSTFTCTNCTYSLITDTQSGGQAMLMTRTNPAQVATARTPVGNLTPVIAGDTYWFEIALKATSAGPITAGFIGQMLWYDASKTLLATNGTSNFALPDSLYGPANISGSLYRTWSRKFVVPAGAVYMGIGTNLQTAYPDNSIQIDRMRVLRANAAQLILDGELQANMVTTGEFITGSAQIKQAIITDGHVVSLSANKIRVLPGEDGLPIGLQVGTSGVTLGAVVDPAARINAHTTYLDAGKIRLVGSTTVADWRMAGDLTNIDGGKLSANTVRANSLVIGMRGVTTDDLTFRTNGNVLSWLSGGKIQYLDNNGISQSVTINSGSVTFSGATQYVYWTMGDTSLSVTTSRQTAFDAVPVVVYSGGNRLNLNAGRTRITGDYIETGTIRASNLIETEALITKNAQLGVAVVKSININGFAIAYKNIFRINDGPDNLATTRNWVLTSTSAWKVLTRLKFKRSQGYRTKFTVTFWLAGAGSWDSSKANSAAAQIEVYRRQPNNVEKKVGYATAKSGEHGFAIPVTVVFFDDDTGDNGGSNTRYTFQARKHPTHATNMTPHIDTITVEVEQYKIT